MKIPKAYLARPMLVAWTFSGGIRLTKLRPDLFDHV
jgi:hypothetical protein